MTPDAQRTIAVLMTCYNRRETTLACLAQLAGQELPPNARVRNFLVDDGCTDGTGSAVRTAYPEAEVLEGDGTLFWCNGMRVAWEAAAKHSPSAYLWLNDDVSLEPDAVARLLRVLDDTEVRQGVPAIVIGACRDPHSGQTSYGGQKRLGTHPARLRLLDPGTEAIPCDTFNGNIVLVSSATYRRIGGLRKFRHTMGDIDYGLRARQHGCAVVLAPGYIGTCAINTKDSLADDKNRPMREKMRLMNKRLSPWDWWRLLYAHSGWLALLYWPWPYVRVLLRLQTKAR
jgi:GT2 family glycosyltransferase